MPSYPIWSSGSTDSIAPQIYQWAAADRAEQSANIGRRTAYDQQAIANAQNYYQFARGNENQDYERQRQAEAETFRRQTVATEEARRIHAAKENFALQRDYLKKQDEWKSQDQATKLLIDNFKTAQSEREGREGGIAWLHENLGEGKHTGKTDAQLAQMAGIPKEQVAEIAGTYRKAFPQRSVDALNARVAEIVAKTDPSKINLEGIAGLSAELPASVRDHVTFNPATKRFELLENAFRPVMGELRYNFGDSGGTGTTPPPRPAPLMQSGNQGGGYFPPTPPPPEAPTAPAAQAQAPTYAGEGQARAAGHRKGDVVRIAGVGVVRLD